MRTRTPFLAAALAALSSAASAGPLDKSRVPADAAWIVHVDIESALRCSVARFILEESDHADLGQLNDFKAEFGVDPLSDFMDATVFGVSGDGEDAVAVITTTPAIDDAIKALAASGHEYTKVAEGAYELLAWEDGDQVQYSLIRPLGDDRRLLFLSKDKSRLAAAADAAAGRARSLDDRADGALAKAPRAGAFLFIASDVIPSHAHNEQASMVLGKARAVRFELGEAGENLFADLSITTASKEDATSVVEVLTGLKAMGRMFCQGNPDLAPVAQLADAIKLSADEASVGIRVRFPAAAAIEAIKAAEQAEADDEHNEDDKNDEDDESDEDEDEPV